MFSLKLVNFSFLLFYVIIYSKAYNTSIKSMYLLDKLLNFPGWKNLNDVRSIEYRHKTYYLNNLIQTPTLKVKGEQKIRALTIYLSCTYAKVMNNIFSVIINWQKMYKEENKEEINLINRCIYTEELINTITTLIVPIATLLKGAIDTLDLLHHLPWATFKNYHQKPIISHLLDKIGCIFDQLNDSILSIDDRFTNCLTFNLVHIYFDKIIDELKHETDTFCEFVPYNSNYLWNKCIQEYRAFNNQGVQLIFFKFLTKKIKDYIKTVIVEKYFQLGFKFDPITNETFIQSPKELFELELEFRATDEEPSRTVKIITY
ncbi:uncharacterized protein LOC126907398 [Daktulosphaira vitifoliae]|uniref:uncharacterized protein LOC126907398 n=1 Tax=Daktulosphaira vitifoliae TaxID=58002 RepID=UPI0021AA6ED8|nr:uncharacterized protein LOC126907398 [Daktulosphaira vitifoliae]